MTAAEAPIVVVSGLPRSGTSLAMALIEAAGVPPLIDAARAPDASNPRGYYELAAVRRTARDAGWLDAAPGRAVKVIHRLLAALPRDRSYRVVMMRRPVDEVVASQNRMLERLGERSDDLDPGRLARVLAAQRDEAVALLDRAPCFDWIELDYPALVAEPVPACARLLDFLRGVDGLGLAPDASPERLARRVDPSLHRERSGA